MPADFLMEQMAWREALEEARSEAELDALNDQLNRGPRQGSAAHRASCSTRRATPQAAAQQVRGLMFIERFGHDVEARFEQLGQ